MSNETRGGINRLEGLLPSLENFTVANAVAADSVPTGTIAYFSNGAAGSAILAFSDGTNWKRSDTGATVSAS